MTDDEQQEVFSREMEKRMDQLCDELNIDCIFILGWLQRMQWRVQQEMDFDEIEENMRREFDDI
jgi:DNA-directed RNA polymerase delta subunit